MKGDLKKVISVTPIYLVPKTLVPLRFLDGVVKIPESSVIRWWRPKGPERNFSYYLPRSLYRFIINNTRNFTSIKSGFGFSCRFGCQRDYQRVSGATIVSGSCACPSHLWISRVLTSSSSLGISSLFCRATQCM